jgi:putative membrane protein insertion efficiency factor
MQSWNGTVNWVLGQALLLAVGVYRLFGSLWLSGSCRFEPSCSCYAEEAISRHGWRRGGWLAIRRLCSCRPGGRFGWDPVPDLKTREV